MPGVLIEYRNAPVAQRTEQRSSKPKVVGSNPAGGAWVGVKRMNFFLLNKAIKVEFPLLEEWRKSCADLLLILDEDNVFAWRC